MIRLRSSTDGMARLVFIVNDGGDAAEVTAGGGANKAGPFADAQRGGFDEGAIPPQLSLRCAEAKRAIDFVVRQRPDGNGDAPFAEVALWIEVAGRCALDRGMAGNIHRVGDQR